MTGSDILQFKVLLLIISLTIGGGIYSFQDNVTAVRDTIKSQIVCSK